MLACVRSTSFSLLLCTITYAADAQPDVLTPLKVLELPLPPGERSVTAMWILPVSPGPVVRVFAKGKSSLAGISYSAGSWSALTNTPLLAEGASAPVVNLYGRFEFFLGANGHFMAGEKPACTNWLDEGAVAGSRPKEPNGFQLSRVITADSDGNLYTAGKDGFLFRYSPKSSATNKLEQLTARLPAVLGREPWASLDAAVLGPDGLIYGGTFDGYIFAFNPKTLEVINYGKPLRQQRIQGLAFSKGKLYGVGGEPDGLPRSFGFDPHTKSFQLGGTLKFGRGAYEIIMEPIGAMVSDKDGNIYLGTTGRLGNLYLWEAEK